MVAVTATATATVTGAATVTEAVTATVTLTAITIVTLMAGHGCDHDCVISIMVSWCIEHTNNRLQCRT